MQNSYRQFNSRFRKKSLELLHNNNAKRETPVPMHDNSGFQTEINSENKNRSNFKRWASHSRNESHPVQSFKIITDSPSLQATLNKTNDGTDADPSVQSLRQKGNTVSVNQQT